MTKAEVRETKDYAEAVEKIKGYPQGFTFTLNYSKIPKPKANALNIITDDCIKAGILESIEIGLDITGNIVEEKFRRL